MGFKSLFGQAESFSVVNTKHGFLLLQSPLKEFPYKTHLKSQPPYLTEILHVIEPLGFRFDICKTKK